MFWRDLFLSCLAVYINFCAIVIWSTGLSHFIKYTKRHKVTKNSFEAICMIILLGIVIVVIGLPLIYVFYHINYLAIGITTFEIGYTILLRHFGLDGISGNLI